MESRYPRTLDRLCSGFGRNVTSLTLLYCTIMMVMKLSWCNLAEYARTKFQEASINSTISPINPLKRVVVAAHYAEDVAWLGGLSQHWEVIIMGPGGLPANKGNEAMAYLTYIIQNYDNLPESMVFIHSHETSWHTPESQIETLLKIPCWEKVPYASITSAAINGRGI